MTYQTTKNFVAALLLSAAPLDAQAQVFAIPANDPVASIAAPDDWEPKIFGAGVEMTSPDTEIYIAMEVLKAYSLPLAIQQTVKTLARDGLKIDAGGPRDIDVNGLKAHRFAYARKDKYDTANFTLTLVETARPDAFLMISYWGSEQAEKSYAAELGAILQSIRATP